MLFVSSLFYFFLFPFDHGAIDGLGSDTNKNLGQSYIREIDLVIKISSYGIMRENKI